MLVSVVVPCYNSEKTIEKLVDEVVLVFDKLEDYQCEFVLVNDFSRDKTFEAITRAAGKYPFVKGVNLAKNFGQHNAILAAMNYAKGDLILGMDDDLQHQPDQIPLLLKKLEEGYDVVYGVYRQRKFSPWKNFTGKVSKFLLWHLLERPKDIQISSFWVCRKYVRDEIIKFDGYNTYLQILFFRTTHNMANVEIEHHEREYGHSNYTFRKGMALMLSSLNYTVIPLRLATFLGIVFSVGGFVGAVAVIVQKLLNPGIAIGWSSIMCALLVFFGFAFLMLGIIGEYIGKLILNINKTPQYVVRETLNIEKKEVSEND